jgi:hypothetical protein
MRWVDGGTSKLPCRFKAIIYRKFLVTRQQRQQQQAMEAQVTYCYHYTSHTHPTLALARYFSRLVDFLLFAIPTRFVIFPAASSSSLSAAAAAAQLIDIKRPNAPAWNASAAAALLETNKDGEIDGDWEIEWLERNKAAQHTEAEQAPSSGR